MFVECDLIFLLWFDMSKYFLILGSLLLAGCFAAPQEGEDLAEEASEETVVLNVEVSEVVVGSARAVFRSTAVIEADRQAVVTTKSAGIILQLQAEEGDFVKAGVELLVLESDEQRLSLKRAEAAYQKSRNVLQRSEKLLVKGLINKQQVDNLRYETKSLKAALEQAEMNLSFTRVKAPFAGVVSRRYVKIGNLIQSGTRVFEIVDFGSLQAKISVPEHHWGLIKEGLQVNFEFDALQGRLVEGVVERVSPVVDSSTGTFQVTVAVENDERLLRPGLFAKAEVVYDRRDGVVLVDKSAVIRQDDESYVYLVEGEDRVRKMVVEVGYEMEQMLEVVSGLKSGQKVVTVGKNGLSGDSRIFVVNR